MPSSTGIVAIEVVVSNRKATSRLPCPVRSAPYGAIMVPSTSVQSHERIEAVAILIDAVRGTVVGARVDDLVRVVAVAVVECPAVAVGVLLDRRNRRA